MNTRIQTPNARYVCKFYTQTPTTLSQPEQDELGQLVTEYSLHCKGIFAKEKPKKPREIREGDRTVNETEFILIGKWTRSLEKVTHGMFCFIPTLSKLYAVNGDAIDPDGMRQHIHIYIVDNVTQEIKEKIPGAM